MCWGKGLLLQISQEGLPTGEGKLPKELKQFLSDFKEVFAQPKVLPLSQSHDHKIILKEGTQPISIDHIDTPITKKQ